jgi:hypothetical protein
MKTITFYLEPNYLYEKYIFNIKLKGCGVIKWKYEFSAFYCHTDETEINRIKAMGSLF